MSEDQQLNNYMITQFKSHGRKGKLMNALLQNSSGRMRLTSVALNLAGFIAEMTSHIFKHPKLQDFWYSYQAY